MTPCPSNENPSSPQDCATARKALPGEGLFTPPRLGFQLAPRPAQLADFQEWLCGDDRAAPLALYLTCQMPISSLIHSLSRSFMNLFIPPLIPGVFARRCARRWERGGKQEIVLMSLWDQEPRRTARH